MEEVNNLRVMEKQSKKWKLKGVVISGRSHTWPEHLTLDPGWMFLSLKWGQRFIFR